MCFLSEVMGVTAVGAGPLRGRVRFLSCGAVRNSPAKERTSGWLFCPRRDKKLADVAAESGADALEGRVEAGGQSLHAGGGAEGDQSNDQGVFNEILTLFAAGQVLELHIQLEEHGVHFVFSP